MIWECVNWSGGRLGEAHNWLLNVPSKGNCAAVSGGRSWGRWWWGGDHFVPPLPDVSISVRNCGAGPSTSTTYLTPPASQQHTGHTWNRKQNQGQLADSFSFSFGFLEEDDLKTCWGLPAAAPESRGGARQLKTQHDNNFICCEFRWFSGWNTIIQLKLLWRESRFHQDEVKVLGFLWTISRN